MILFSRVVLGIAWCCLVAAAKASTTPSTPSFGVCYYPEQWPDSTLETDCRNIAGSGIEFVRVGEFAWSVLEPSEGHFNWTVLDAALDQLYANQLKVVLGTPTATPPKWLVDKYPDVLPVAKDGTIRHFGSRRHYSFSSPSYLNQTVRFVTAMATRYGAHPAVAGWQLDNELGCHDTVQSFDDNAKLAFRTWLAQRYNTVDRLNAAWGNIFWSMDYGNFDEVDLPNLTVTEANPAQWLDWYRFSSDQLVAYAKVQADIIRRLSPTRFVTHNFMGFFFEFDSFALSKLLDFGKSISFRIKKQHAFMCISSSFSTMTPSILRPISHPGYICVISFPICVVHSCSHVGLVSPGVHGHSFGHRGHIHE